ncbi:PP277 [Orf virus]|uniref:Viral interleukin-10 homolog n=2 Tax=Orf virus TaxID=10258 RepID=F1AXI3_ORFV|nr:interleukin 10 [Orf virus strain D1701]ADY76812.1 PP277 [Orf virus]
MSNNKILVCVAIILTYTLYTNAYCVEYLESEEDKQQCGSNGASSSSPHMLRELRAAFGKVKTFFQMKDQLNSMLLTQSLLDDFKGYLGCQALSEMIQFYLEEVMPQAENHGPDVKEHVNSLGEKLKTLRLRLRRCHRFLPCENKSKAVAQVKRVFNMLQERGVYKAMSEFDIFINYIESYMTTKS